VSVGQTASRHRSLRLAVTLHEHGDGLSGTCSFDAALYDTAGCQALMARFARVLAAAAEDPDRPPLPDHGLRSRSSRGVFPEAPANRR